MTKTTFSTKEHYKRFQEFFKLSDEEMEKHYTLSNEQPLSLNSVNEV